MTRLAAEPRFWSLHTHSRFSFNDALPAVQQIVDRAVELEYPAIGLTDHGNMSGSVQLYKAARKAGIEPLPGMEMYVVPDTGYAGRSDSMHLTVAAYTETGYRNLVHLANTASRKFWYKPLVDFGDLAAMAEAGATRGLVIATGCYFGLLPQVAMKQGIPAAIQLAHTLQGWFPRVYVEMQNHGIGEHNDGGELTDDELNEVMWEVAQRGSIPTIITRDSHYVHEKDRPLHEALKQLVSFSEDPDEAVFPGGGYFMTDAEGMRPFLEPKYLEAGLASLHDLATAAYVRIPELEEFSLRVPSVSLTGDPQSDLESKTTASLSAEQRKDAGMMATLKAEFDVIRESGMAEYLLLVIEVCEFMREKKINYGARGSAAGSLVLYQNKVTQVDPIRFGLRLDRFLSRNRLKPPDVDLDVEHARRDEVVAFITKKWAVRAVGNIGKYGLFDDDEGEGDSARGSLRVRYFSTLRKRLGAGAKIPEWRDLPAEDKKMLFDLADLKLLSGYGKHAAGYIVAPNESDIAKLPLAYIASSKNFVTAYGKKDVEVMGWVKLDLLGLKTRTAIRVTCDQIGLDFETIPENDQEVMKMIGAGNTAGVFQLEGYAMSTGCKQVKPRTIEDIIAAQALFRPATMRSGATGDYRSRRARREPVPTRHEDIMSATKDTWGVLLYQEQIMDVMSTLGMIGLELEEMLDAVKASNEYSEGAAVVIREKMPRIRELAAGRGWSQIDIEWLIDGIGAYAEYSFNKAHAASYGVIAYRTAWLRKHHPVEFWLGMLIAYDGDDKVPGYVTAARKDGVKILPPHVNSSGATYTYDKERHALRRGLTAVKGVGLVGARELAEKAPFTSLTDLGERVLARRVSGAKALVGKTPAYLAGGMITALEDAGALDGLET